MTATTTAPRLARIAGARSVRALVGAGFRSHADRRRDELARLDPAVVQERTLLALLRLARGTRFGLDHRFDAIRTVDGFRRRVPLRRYEDLWDGYYSRAYPVFRNLTWPGRIPYLALTSGTTQGATKYIPVSRAMLKSNQKAAKSMVAAHLLARPNSRLFDGRIFFLGGSTALAEPAPGVREGDLSAIASLEVAPWLRPYTFPPLSLALESDWDRKLDMLADAALREPITMVGGVPSWLLMLFQRMLAKSGKSTMAEVWPKLEAVVHGGVKFDPYRESFARVLGTNRVLLHDAYACSEGFVAHGEPGRSGELTLIYDHGIFYEFVPVDELDAERPTRHSLGEVQLGVNYALVMTTCAGLWAHVVGDTVRFTSLKPPRLVFTGRTKYCLSAFGEHLISEEVEAAMAAAGAATGADVGEWHVGPVFHGPLGHHQFVVEFLRPPADLAEFRRILDAQLTARNADYQAHRADGVGLPLPAIVVARPGAFVAWMRSRGKLGGQHKVPRMDGSGTLTAEIVDSMRAAGQVDRELAAG